MQPVLTGPVAGGSSIRKGGATATAVRSKSVRLGPVSSLFPVHATGPLNTSGTGVAGGGCGGCYAVLGVLGVLGTFDVIVVVNFVIVVVVGGVVLRMRWRSLVTYV